MSEGTCVTLALKSRLILHLLSALATMTEEAFAKEVAGLQN